MRICLVEGCGVKHYAKDLCAPHYWKRQNERKKGYYAQYRETNRDRIRKRDRDRIAKDPETNRNRVKQWQREFPGKMNAKGKVYRDRNVEKEKARAAKYRELHIEERNKFAREHYKKNKERYFAYSVNHRARKLNATPSWAIQWFIQEALHLARVRSKVTGFKWHVDHIVPLKSKKVCGLHWEGNLQVIPALENRKKLNVYWPDMP